jgi:hypothetical protein
MTKLRWKSLLAALVAVAAFAVGASAQVTSGSIAGLITGPGGNPVAGVRVTATHVPSGTLYNALSRADGRYTIPAVCWISISRSVRTPRSTVMLLRTTAAIRFRPPASARRTR